MQLPEHPSYRVDRHMYIHVSIEHYACDMTWPESTELVWLAFKDDASSVWIARQPISFPMCQMTWCCCWNKRELGYPGPSLKNPYPSWLRIPMRILNIKKGKDPRWLFSVSVSNCQAFYTTQCDVMQGNPLLLEAIPTFSMFPSLSNSWGNVTSFSLWSAWLWPLCRSLSSAIRVTSDHIPSVQTSYAQGGIEKVTPPLHPHINAGTRPGMRQWAQYLPVSPTMSHLLPEKTRLTRTGAGFLSDHESYTARVRHVMAATASRQDLACIVQLRDRWMSWQ